MLVHPRNKVTLQKHREYIEMIKVKVEQIELFLFWVSMLGTLSILPLKAIRWPNWPKTKERLRLSYYPQLLSTQQLLFGIL